MVRLLPRQLHFLARNGRGGGPGGAGIAAGSRGGEGGEAVAILSHTRPDRAVRHSAMGRIEKTIFLSYRRTDEWVGVAIFQDLTQHGYDVFIDYDGIASGNFEAVILENIRARAHFLILLTPTALERCSDPKDWMRREIEAALDSQRNIVPLMFAGFDFRTPTTASQLTGKLAELKDYNGLKIPEASFFSSQMERLRDKFLNVPVDAVLHTASVSAQQVAKEQKDKALNVRVDAVLHTASVSTQQVVTEQKDKATRAPDEQHKRPWLIGGGAVGIAAVIALWVLQLYRTPVTQSPPPTSNEQPAQAPAATQPNPATQSPPPTSNEQPAQAPAATQPNPALAVREIRCETRQAIIELAIGWLVSEQNQIEGKIDSASRAIGLQFMNGRPIQEFSPKLFKGRTHDIVTVLYDSGVAYMFGPFIKGGLDRKRENGRLFTVSDSFSGLFHLPGDYCADPTANRSYNFVVPGNYIGVKRLVQDFIELSVFGSISGLVKGPPTLVQQRSFTSELSGSKDFHEVTVGLALGGEQNAVAAVNQFSRSNTVPTWK
jgi:hypothetical protein